MVDKDTCLFIKIDNSYHQLSTVHAILKKESVSLKEREAIDIKSFILSKSTSASRLFSYIHSKEFINKTIITNRYNKDANIVMLEVTDDISEDVINYQYLLSLLIGWDNLYCCITQKNKASYYILKRNLLSFFSFYLMNPINEGRICISDGADFINLKPENEIQSYRVVPAISIDFNAGSIPVLERYDFWSKPVASLFEQSLAETGIDFRSIPTFRSIRRIQDSNEQKMLRKKIYAAMDMSPAWRILFHSYCYFCDSDSTRSQSIKKAHMSLLKNPDVWDYLKASSLFAFFLFCICIYFTGRIMDEYSFIRYYISVTSIAESALQIMENIRHSSFGKGTACFRVYKNDDASYQMEYCIKDLSEYGIVETFWKQHSAEWEGKRPKLEDFFSFRVKNKTWDKYNSYYENIIHHLGIQTFVILVENHGGKYRVISCGAHEPDESDIIHSADLLDYNGLHIQGTEYRVFIPLSDVEKQYNTALEANVEYSFSMKNNYVAVPIQHYNCDSSNKTKWINGLAVFIEDSLKKTSNGEIIKVLFFNMKEWGADEIEILCKAIMICALRCVDKSFYVAIRNCRSVDFVIIAAYFAIFYGKCSGHILLDGLQLYLSGRDENDEFIIAGADIGGVLNLAEKMSLVRGVESDCVNSIRYVMEKFGYYSKPQHHLIMDVVPFDMIEYCPNTTLFEKSVVKIISNDMQSREFGCKVQKTHVRVGSKIHIGDFYEAELLFHNDYYVKRFAMLTARRIIDVNRPEKKLVLVGYETYSELLLYDVMCFLISHGIECSYMLYEQNMVSKFRYYNDKFHPEHGEWGNYYYVMIVPVNSSLTTFNKLRAALIHEAGSESDGMAIKKGILLNIALIHIRSEEDDEEPNELERRYFRKKGTNILTICSGEGEYVEIHYFVSVKTEWQHPLNCKFCFPYSNSNERPLIEMNRASIVPRQLIGIPDNFTNDYFGRDSGNDISVENSEENEKRVRALGDCMYYGHVIRSEKHFMYYFFLESYFQRNRDSIIEWIESLNKDEDVDDNVIIYDIIVAPLHFSNAGFVEEVNHYLYGGAALVLNYEVDKEYRENVRTKYSNIILLYEKLKERGEKSHLRFHYIDDTIITGRTFYRAKSVFSSLFVDNGTQSNIRITVFEDVTILLNRLSQLSIMNYVSSNDAFRSYVHLNISSMRNYEDACTLCRIVDESDILRDRSITNDMYAFWDRRINKHRMQRVEVIRPLDDEHKERAVKRMLCTHRLNGLLGGLGCRKNEQECVYEVFSKVLEACWDDGDEEEAVEWFISYIKVMGRPFISNRKSCVEAAFKIILLLIEFMTNDLSGGASSLKKATYTRKYPTLSRTCSRLRDRYLTGDDMTTVADVYIVLLQRASALGSNYVIRKVNIERIHSFVQRIGYGKKGHEMFFLRYIAMAKRIISLSSDENKCIFLEYMLLFKEEYTNEIREKELTGQGSEGLHIINNDPRISELLFLENTRVLYDGIVDLVNETKDNGSTQCDQRYILSVLNRYYYENFRRLMLYYGILKAQDGTISYSDNCVEIISSIVNIYILLNTRLENHINIDVEDFYDNFLSLVECITCGTNARLIFLQNDNRNTSSGINAFEKRKKENIETIEFRSRASELLYETYCFENSDSGSMLTVLFRNYVGSEYSNDDNTSMDNVYLQVEFANEISYVRRLIALKMLLTFRNIIVKNMELDFSNNLMQKWSAASLFQKNMMLERASDHTDRDDLEGDLSLILSPFEKKEGMNRDYLRAFYYLVINSYLARFNVQVLANSLPEGENEPQMLGSAYRTHIRALIHNLRFIEEKEFALCDKQGKRFEDFPRELMYAKLRMAQGKRRGREHLTNRRLSIIIMELIISGIKYSDDRIVYIYREGGYLVVKNSFTSSKSMDEIKDEAKNAYLRKREGISLAVIKELIEQFYDESIKGKNEKLYEVNIRAEEEDGRRFYYVELPIFEIEEG